MYSNGNLFPLLSLSEIVSCEIGPAASLLYCKTCYDMVLSAPHFSFSMGIDQRTWLAVSQIFGGTQFSKMNVDLPMDGQPVWLVSGVCSTGSGRTISKEHFRAFESILGNIIILSLFVVNCRRSVCVSRCIKGLKISSSNSRAL